MWSHFCCLNGSQKCWDKFELISSLKRCDFLYADSSFKEFFHHEDNLQLWDKFKIYHIDAPGQVSFFH